MKSIVAVLGVVLALAVVGVAAAEVNGVTPSTNDQNKANGWAYVEQTGSARGTIQLTFTSTRAFLSCFEYRSDGDTSQKIGDDNYNSQVTDGLYPFTCVNNESKTVTVDAKRYVEVRMVFGAESDERFDWTRFDNAVPWCTSTGFSRDGIDLTAAQIGGDVTGELDATGCNIGVYYGPGDEGLVNAADVFGANYFGVLADGAQVDVTGSTVRDIGESPLNGAQHGNAVVYLNGSTGTVGTNQVVRYQKNGITVSGAGTAVSVLDNVVTGEGPVGYIAQNGIQVSYGATALVRGNTVSGNYYTGPDWVSCGLLFYDASGVKQQANAFSDNQAPLCNVGRGGGRFGG